MRKLLMLTLMMLVIPTLAMAGECWDCTSVPEPGTLGLILVGLGGLGSLISGRRNKDQ